MNVKVLVLISLVSSMVYAHWKMSIVDYQGSDLTIEYAWRYDKFSQRNRLRNMTKHIQQSEHKKLAVVDYDVKQRGLAFVAHDSKGTMYDIFFDGQATHSIAWNRSKIKAIASFPSTCNLQDGVYCARALMEKIKTDSPVIASASLGYYKEQQEFKVVIRGYNGSYSITLEPVGLQNS